ncbi:MAG: hypothetical protein OXK21_05055 [Chloroflexota bacterium]|nr:hypothetical protein [Chloroflexota bacterium]
MKNLRTTILVLLALVALFAVACGDSEEETVVEPTPEPTVEPTPVPPTPVPPTPVPEPTAAPTDAMPDTPAAPAAMTFDVPNLEQGATGQDIVDNLLTEEEATCVRNNIGDQAYQTLLQSPVLDPSADVTGGQVLGPCLSKESTVLFFLAGFNAATGGTISPETLNCIGNGLLPLEVDILSAEPDPSVMFAFVPCLSPEEMAALTALGPPTQ